MEIYSFYEENFKRNSLITIFCFHLLIANCGDFGAGIVKPIIK
jgi:hypothetical protein